MIGKYQIEIDAKDFVRGMSTSDHIADGGFSSETDQTNITSPVGTIHSPALPTDASTNLAGEIIASAGDANVLGNSKYFLTDTGKFYTWNDTTLTLRQTDAVKTYQENTSDFVQFQLQAFATSTTDVTLLTGTDLATIDATWWTVTKAKSPLQTSQRHPLLVYENSMWIGDKEKLHQWDGTTATEGKLVLSSEQSIVSLGIEPGSGYMLIATTEGTNASNTKPHIAKIHIWDGFSTKPLRTIIVEDAVNTIYSVGGTTFMTYGTKLGYWNGSGITYLRTFKNLTLNSDTLIYKHRISSVGNTLYIADGPQVLAYGEVLPGAKVFYYALKNSPAGTPTNINVLANIGNGNLGFGYPTAKFYTWSPTSVASSNTSDFKTNRFNFPRPVYIRSAYVEWSDVVGNNITPATLRIIDENGTETLFSSLQNISGSNTYFIQTSAMDLKVRTAQFRIVSNAGNYGIRRLVIYYDVAE